EEIRAGALELCPKTSTNWGSRVLAGALGGSITHQCFYSPSPANKHQRKFWCKVGAQGLCSTIISSSFTSSHYQGRVALRDVPQDGTFTVTMAGLRSSDSGTYRCGIGRLQGQDSPQEVLLLVCPSSATTTPRGPTRGSTCAGGGQGAARCCWTPRASCWSPTEGGHGCPAAPGCCWGS
uniref:Ig-like domain-containing protein n=1 Tax=Serinus canaria TaxID=9135 RepID=A0A8C9NDB3_SERCA